MTVCAQLRARPPPQVQGGPPATPPVGPISRPHSGPTVAALAPAQSDLGQPHGSPCSPCTPRGNEQPKRQPPPVPPGASPHTRLVHSGEYEVATFSAACASPASLHCSSPGAAAAAEPRPTAPTSSCCIPKPGAAPPLSPEPARDRCQASKLPGHGVHASGRSRQPVLQRARPSPSGHSQRRLLTPTQPSSVRRRGRASLGQRGTPTPCCNSERGPARAPPEQNRPRTLRSNPLIMHQPSGAPQAGGQPASPAHTLGPRLHPPPPSPFCLVAPASVPAVTHSRAPARSWC